MGLKALLKKMQKKIVVPVYIPVLEGDYLRDKTVLITGGGSGIGRSIALTCLKNGAYVIIVGRNSEKLNGFINELSEEYRVKCKSFVLDISCINEIENVMNDIIHEIAPRNIDVLINNAGVAKGRDIGETVCEDFDETIGINLRGTYFLSQYICNYFVKKAIKGNILNISSVSGGRPAISPYMISKWGINGLTRGLAKKYIKYGIVVNGIAPGPTNTEMICGAESNLIYSQSPSGRYVDSYEVANLVVMLISDIGRMIVGETINISGGCGTLTYDDMTY